MFLDGKGLSVAIPLRLAKFLIRTGLARRMPDVRRVVGKGLDYLPYYSDGVLMAPNAELLATQALFARARELATSDEGQELIDLSLGAPRFRRRQKPGNDAVSERLFDPSPLNPPQHSVRESAGPFDAGHLAPLEDGQQASDYPPPWGLQELRQAIADKLHRENELTYSPERETLVTTGVSQGISLAVDTFVNPGDKVVLFDPSFFVYSFALRIKRARIAWVPAPAVEGNIQIDLRKLERAMRGAKLLVINTPSNPTGAVLEIETLQRIVHLARKHKVLLFSDEVYERFLYDGRFTSTAALKHARERTITANSFSKSYALASYRVGYLAAAEGLMRPMQMNLLVRSPFVPTVCQKLALKLLSEPDGCFPDVLANYDRNRHEVARRLGALGLHCPMPKGAFYFWISLTGRATDGRAFSRALLEQKRVLVMPGNDFGPSGAGYVRLSYACSPSALDEGLRRLQRFLETALPKPTALRSVPTAKPSAWTRR